MVWPQGRAAVIGAFHRGIDPQALGLPELVHGAAGPEILVLRQNDPLCTPQMPEPGHMIRIQMGQHYGSQILRLEPQGRKLLVDGLSRGQTGMVKGRKRRGQHRRRGLGIVDSGGRDIPAPARVHQDRAPGMLDQKAEHRQLHPVFLRRQQLPHAAGQTDLVPKRNLGGDPHASAAQEMQLHSLISRSCTHSFLIRPTRCCSASTTWGRMSPPMSTSMMSSPRRSSPSLSQTRT